MCIADYLWSTETARGGAGSESRATRFDLFIASKGIEFLIFGKKWETSVGSFNFSACCQVW